MKWTSDSTSSPCLFCLDSFIEWERLLIYSTDLVPSVGVNEEAVGQDLMGQVRLYFEADRVGDVTCSIVTR